MAATSYDEAFVERVVRALDAAGLEAIVVGGIAAILHGAPITTQDIDLLIRRTLDDGDPLEASGRASEVIPTRLTSSATATPHASASRAWSLEPWLVTQRRQARL